MALLRSHPQRPAVLLRSRPQKTSVRRRLAEGMGVGLAEASRILAALFGPDGLVTDALARGERVGVAGFGTLIPITRPARRSYDIRTRGTRMVPESRTVRWDASRKLRRRLTAL